MALTLATDEAGSEFSVDASPRAPEESVVSLDPAPMPSRIPPPDDSQDAKVLPDEELVRRGREALKQRRFAAARELLSEYCRRLGTKGHPISPIVLANYALSLGHTQRLKEGIEVAMRAVSQARRNPEVALCLARLYVLARQRRRAVEELERALRISPRNRDLVRLRMELGVRRSPPIPFLSRASAVNVRIGRVLARLKGRPTTGATL